MAVLDDCRKVTKELEAHARIDIATSTPALDVLRRMTIECERLQKETALLRARNAWLVFYNLVLFLMLVAVVCGAFLYLFMAS